MSFFNFWGLLASFYHYVYYFSQQIESAKKNLCYNIGKGNRGSFLFSYSFIEQPSRLLFPIISVL